MFAAPCSDRKIRIIAMTLVVALCLPLLSGALAAAGPSAPENLTAVAGNGQVALVWFAPENDGGAAITSYQVSMDGGAAWTDIGLGTSYTYSGLDSGLMYMFMVRAVNSAGVGDEAITTAKPSGSGAEAAPTPTPAPTGGLDALIDSWFGATPTPAPTGNGTGTGTGGGQGIRPGGGGQGTGEGQKPGDQPQDPPQPPLDVPPPQVEPPPPEENIPVEIDPKDVTEKPLKPKKEKVQKAVTVWTVTAEGTQSWFPGHYGKLDATLGFKAVCMGDTMYGDYSGEGTLQAVVDEDYYHATTPDPDHGAVSLEYEVTGPLADIRFTLEKVKGEPDAAYRRAMAEYEKAVAEYNKYMVLWNEEYDRALRQIEMENINSIMEYNVKNPGELWPKVIEPKLTAKMAEYEDGNPRPPKPKKPQNKNAYTAKGKGTMYWNCSTVKNYFTSPWKSGEAMPSWEPHNIDFEVTIYANGNGVVSFFWGGMLSYKARLVKSVQMVDVD